MSAVPLSCVVLTLPCVDDRLTLVLMPGAEMDWNAMLESADTVTDP